MTKTMLRPYALLLCLSLPLVACGGAAEDPNTPPSTTVGQPVVTTGAQTVSVENQGGGFIPQPPAGSDCLPGARKFTVTFATSTVDYTVCVGGSGTTPYKKQTGMKVLSATQLGEVRALFDALKVVARTTQCAADASIMTASVSTPAGTQEYLDDLNQCTDKTKPLLSRAAIQSALDKLAALSM